MEQMFVKYVRGEETFHFMAVVFPGRSGNTGGKWRTV